MTRDRKLILSAMIGNILEYYDFTLFVFLTPVLSPLFFPSDNSVVSLMAGLATYAVGFVMRPFGSALFGAIGDRWGRKRALMLSIFLMAIPTGLIGLLPTYDQIGLIAPVLLIVCRLCQGLCTGGEYNGASLFTVENTTAMGAGRAGAWISASSALGSLLGSGMTLVVTLPLMPSWAWRVAFLLGILVALVGVYLRQQVREDRDGAWHNQVAFVPLPTLMVQHKSALMCVFGMAACCGMMYAVTLRYTTLFLTTFSNWSMSHALRLNMVGTIAYVVLMPLGGRLADRWGLQKMMRSGAVATALSICPVLWLLSQAQTWSVALVAQLLLVVLAVWFQSPMNAFMAQLFPIHCRYRGVALGYTLGQALLGGTTSLIATALMYTFDTPVAPGLYMMAGAIVGWIAVAYAQPRFPLRP